MLSIVNGARITPPKPNISVAKAKDPNAELTVVNGPRLISEEKGRGPAPNKQIAAFIPDKMKKSLDLTRILQVIVKQRKGDHKELIFKVNKKINAFKQQSLKDTRFAKEVGKGSLHDVLA